MAPQRAELDRLIHASLDDVERSIATLFDGSRVMQLQARDSRGVVARTALRVAVGVPTIGDGMTSWPIAWVPSGQRRFLLAFAGHLEARGLPHATLLTVAGATRLPFGPIGKVAHRVSPNPAVDESLRAFLFQLAGDIRDAVDARVLAFN
ncbi:MAG TPA: hypothetical protein VFB78_06985 [Acidimicrobiales bacterium]|nr:hypothetical protein [Acidimicrobiales bacterium]